MAKRGVWCDTPIPSDFGDCAFKEKLIERDNMLRPLWERPAYKGTELEGKINVSYKAYLQARDRGITEESDGVGNNEQDYLV